MHKFVVGAVKNGVDERSKNGFKDFDVISQINKIDKASQKNNKKRDGMRDKLDEGQPPCLRLVLASNDDHPTTTDC